MENNKSKIGFYMYLFIISCRDVHSVQGFTFEETEVNIRYFTASVGVEARHRV